MSPRTNIQKGLCPKCEGFLQQDKTAHIVYCMNCHWRIDLDDYKDELDSATDGDYKFKDETENLQELNNWRK